MVLKGVDYLRHHLVAGSILLSVGLIATGIWLYTGIYDIAADQPHWNLTSKVIEVLRDRSINTRVAQAAVPVNLGDPGLVKKGAGQFAAMCAVCHTGPGQEASDLSQGLYPRPPDFTKIRTKPSRAFWIIKHGIKMSGMPAWGATHDDAMVWALVGFLQKMPETSAEQYKALIKDAPADHMGSMNESPSAGETMPGMAPMK